MGMKYAGSALVVLLSVAGLSSCWYTDVAPPTVEDLQIQVVPEAAMTGFSDSEFYNYESAAGANWTQTLLNLAADANTFVELALTDWTPESEETFTATVGEYEVDVTWSFSDTRWVWEFEFPVRTLTWSVVLVATAVEGGWDVTIELNDEPFVTGFVGEMSGQIEVDYSTTTYEVSWGPATDDPQSRDHRFEAYQLDESSTQVAGVVIEFTDDGLEGDWSYFNVLDKQSHSGSWPVIPQ